MHEHAKGRNDISISKKKWSSFTEFSFPFDPYKKNSRLFLLGPSSSEDPQKHDLTMFPKCNIYTGTFGLGIKLYTI
jgi:hypothetical protein